MDCQLTLLVQLDVFLYNLLIYTYLLCKIFFQSCVNFIKSIPSSMFLSIFVQKKILKLHTDFSKLQIEIGFRKYFPAILNTLLLSLTMTW